MYMYMLVTHLCPTLCDPMDCGPPGSSVHGVLQARILEWVAISLFRGSSQPRDRTRVSYIAGRFLILSPLGSPQSLDSGRITSPAFLVLQLIEDRSRDFLVSAFT